MGFFLCRKMCLNIQYVKMIDDVCKNYVKNIEFKYQFKLRTSYTSFSLSIKFYA